MHSIYEIPTGKPVKAREMNLVVYVTFHPWPISDDACNVREIDPPLERSLSHQPTTLVEVNEIRH